MPGLDGFAVLQIVRRMEAEEGVFGKDATKVLMVSSTNDAKSIVLAFKSGCEAYLPRPFESEDLYNRLMDLGLLPQIPSVS